MIFKSKMAVPNEIVTKFKAKYQHLLEFFEFVGFNATKVQCVVRNLTMKSFSSQNLSLRIENFAKIFIAIYCNMYYILQYAINRILLHCIFIAIAL